MATTVSSSSDRILQSALELFSSKGYDATSVREICEAAGITKPTLYHFYGSKEGVYRALVDGTLERFRPAVVEAAGRPGQCRGAAEAGRPGATSRAPASNRELMRFLFALVHNPPALGARRPTSPGSTRSVVDLVGRGGRGGRARRAAAPRPARRPHAGLHGRAGRGALRLPDLGQPGPDAVPRRPARGRRSSTAGARPVHRPHTMNHRSFAVFAPAACLPASQRRAPLAGPGRARAPSRPTPTCGRAPQDLARLRGLVTEARADALPELSVLGSGTRFRDPSLLNSPSFDNFPPEFVEQLKPVPAQPLRRLRALLKQTLFSFKLGQAIKAARLGRSVRPGGDPARAAGGGAPGRAGLQRLRARASRGCAWRRRPCARRRTSSRPARNRRAAGRRHRARRAALRGRPRERRAQLLRCGGRGRAGARRLNAVMVRPIDAPIEPTDDLALPGHERARSSRRWPRGLGQPPRGAAGGPGTSASAASWWASRRPKAPEPRVHGQLTAGPCAKPGNFFESDFPRWSAGVVLTRARVRRLAHGGQGGPGPGRAQQGRPGPDRPREPDPPRGAGRRRPR